MQQITQKKNYLPPFAKYDVAFDLYSIIATSPIGNAGSYSNGDDGGGAGSYEDENF